VLWRLAKSRLRLRKLLAQLPHHKVKIKKAGQRACNEKNEKGKFCGGHLKRWFYTKDVIEQACGDAEKAWGPDAEVYRCEHCQTLYLPNPAEAKVNVAGQGMISVFRADSAAERKSTQYLVPSSESPGTLWFHSVLGTGY
jgi:hypothetical protein